MLIDLVHVCIHCMHAVQAVGKIELLEEQLAKEHQLRKVTDNYILDLQAARHEAVGCLDQVKSGQKDVVKHFKSVRYSIRMGTYMITLHMLEGNTEYQLEAGNYYWLRSGSMNMLLLFHSITLPLLYIYICMHLLRHYI